jgi:hypothetical protein
MNRCSFLMAAFAFVAAAGSAWAGEDKKSEPQLRLELELVDGSHLIGIPGTETVPVQTAYAKMDVALKEILTIKMGEDHETAFLDLRNGDKLNGVVSLGPIKLETLFGKISIGVEHVREMRVVLSSAALPGGLSKGLVLHYSFDRDEGDKVTDGSGGRNGGEMKGAKWTAKGKAGGAVQVGKGLGHVQTPDQEAWSFGAKPFSICLWFKFNTLPAGEQMFIGQDEGGGPQNKWAFEFLNGSLTFHINNPSSISHRIVDYPFVPQLDKWYHLTVTRSGDAYNIFIDGVRGATASNGQPVPAVNAPLTIGQAEGLYVDGWLDEVMIFDRALTGDEVKQVYDARK